MWANECRDITGAR